MVVTDFIIVTTDCIVTGGIYSTDPPNYFSVVSTRKLTNLSIFVPVKLHQSLTKLVFKEKENF